MSEDLDPYTTEQPPAPDEETMMPPTGILSGLTINGKPVLPDVPVHVKAGDRVVFNGVTRRVEVLPPNEEPQPSTPEPGGGGLAAQLRVEAVSTRDADNEDDYFRGMAHAYDDAAYMAKEWEARLRAKLAELKAEAEPEAYSDNDVDDYYRALGVLQAVSEIEEVLGE